MADEESPESRTWPVIAKIETIVWAEDFKSGNTAFNELKKTVLASSQEELDNQSGHAELVWKFLIGLATEKGQYRSLIIQVTKRLLEVPQWQAIFNGMITLQKQVRMLHPDLQLACGCRPDIKSKPRKSITSVLDRTHCCTCSNCAKPWAF